MQPPAEANAEAQAADQTVGNVAVADEPAASPTLDTEASGADSANGTAELTPPEAMSETSAPALAPETATPEAAATAEPRATRDPSRSDAAAPATDDSATADPAAAATTDAPQATAKLPDAEAATRDGRTNGATTAETSTSEATTADAPTAKAVSAEAATPDAPAEAVSAEAATPDAPTEEAGSGPAVTAADGAASEAAAGETTPAEAAPVEAAPTAPPARPVPTGPEPTTMEELLAEQDADIKSFKHGDVVEGSVVRIDKDEILVDIGAKSEGVVSNRELYGRNAEAQPALNVGDTVLVYVLQPESPEGHVVLSLRRAGLERKWRSMQEQFEAGVIIEAPVIDHNKGGLIVDCGIRGFVPISQIVDFPRRPQNDQPRDAAQEIAEKLQPFVGRKLRLKILEVNRKANRLILSEKVALYEERREKRDELFSSLQVGQRVKGNVRSIAPFGVFVDLGGIDGLVHKSELSWNKVNNPEGGYKVGEEVEAEVIDINHERGRISLSIRRLQPDPWHSTVADFNVGDIIDGTVTKLVNFGAFVRVRDGLEGLIHISELSNQRVAHPGDVVHEGQQLKLRIISLDSERHRLGLSLKQAEDPSARPASEPMGAMPAGRPDRGGERQDRGERRPRGDRDRSARSYSASDAVQEPEGGIDTTLAAAFAGVREQLARAEAGDDTGDGAAPGPSRDVEERAEVESTAAPSSDVATDAGAADADVDASDAPSSDDAGTPEPVSGAAEPAADEPAADEAASEAPTDGAAKEGPGPDSATDETASEERGFEDPAKAEAIANEPTPEVPSEAGPATGPAPKKVSKPLPRDPEAAKAPTPTADAVAEAGGEVAGDPAAQGDEAASVATAAAEAGTGEDPTDPVAAPEMELPTAETEEAAPESGEESRS